VQKLRPIKITKNAISTRHNQQVLIERTLAIALNQKNLRSVLHNLPNETLTEINAKIKFYLLGENIELNQEIADKLSELELVASQLIGDKRIQMLTSMKELELMEAEKQRTKLMNEFSNIDETDEKRGEILNGAIKGLSKTIKHLKKTGANDEFAGLFELWDSRKI
jgi:hypothetical protein